MSPIVLSQDPISRTTSDAITFNFQKIDNIKRNPDNLLDIYFLYQPRVNNTNNFLYEQIATSSSSVAIGMNPFAACTTKLFFYSNRNGSNYRFSDVGNVDFFLVIGCVPIGTNETSVNSSNRITSEVYLFFPLSSSASYAKTEIDNILALPTNAIASLDLNATLRKSSDYKNSSCYFYRQTGNRGDGSDLLFFIYDQPIRIQTTLSTDALYDKWSQYDNDFHATSSIYRCAFQPKFAPTTTGLKIAPPIQIHVVPDDEAAAASTSSISSTSYAFLVNFFHGMLVIFLCTFVIILLGFTFRKGRNPNQNANDTNDGFTVRESVWILTALGILAASLILMLAGNNFIHNVKAQTNIYYAAGFSFVFASIMLVDFPLSGSSILQRIRGT